MISMKYLLRASALAALQFFVAEAAMAQSADSYSRVGPSQAVYDALRAKPATARKSRLPLAPASVFQRSLSGPQVSPLGSPAIAPTSSDGGNILHDQPAEGISPSAFGTIKIPFTTKRVAVQTLGPSAVAAQVPVTSFPYRATGKMVVTIGADDFDCTAALIRRGLLITAAHCIETFGKGAAGLADAIQFIPAEFSTAAGGPYGVWTGRYWAVTPPYANGTDTCDIDADGVACDNDIAVVVLNQRTIGGVLKWPGQVVGTYAVAVNGYSFVVSPLLGNKRVAQIEQLGYPSAFDASVQMQRTDSVGVYQTATGAGTTNGKVLRTVAIGSEQTGGSSGGPWFVNFGVSPVIDPDVTLGKQRNMAIVGVTSFGSDGGVNDAGSSWFGQNSEYPLANYGNFGPGNVGYLLNLVCSKPAYAPACQP